MVCKECGADLSDEAVFCHQCGVRVVGEGEPEPATTRERFQAAAATKQLANNDGEEDVWQGQYSHRAMFGTWIAAVVFTLLLLVGGALTSPVGWAICGGLIVLMWLVLILLLLYRQFSIHYYLTTQRIVHERGLLWRTIDRIEMIDVDDVTFTQGPVERMLGVGNILVTSSDKSDPNFEIKGIENVREVADQIDDLRRKERRRRGLHIESV